MRVLKRFIAMLRERRGSVTPAATFSLLVASGMAAGTLIFVEDARLASEALVESQASYYAAEAGINWYRAHWNRAQMQSLRPGEALNLDAVDFQGGASVQGTVVRLHTDGQPMYSLTVTGWGGAAGDDQSRIIQALLTFDGDGGTFPMLVGSRSLLEIIP